MSSTKEVDPEGLPLDRKLGMDVSVTGSGISETSPTPLTAEPAGYIIGQRAPGQPEAPLIRVQTRTKKDSLAEEYRQAQSNLPSVISAREIARDASDYVNGKFGNVSWGAK